MTIAELLSGLVRNRLLVAAGAFLGVLAALAVAWRSTPTYTGESFVLLTAANEAGQSSLIGASPTYAQLAAMSSVLGPAAAALDYPGGTAALGKHVSATNPTATSLIAVDAVDRSPDRAAEVSREVAHQLTAFLASDPQARTQVRASVVQLATSPNAPSSASRSKILASGLVVGLALGACCALVREAQTRARRTRGNGIETVSLRPIEPSDRVS